MSSPFPGMNPYLEQPAVWADFHDSLIPAIREQLNRQIRPSYIAKIEELLFIHELGSDERRLVGRADVGIADGSPPHTRSVPSGRAPVYGTLAAAVDIERHPFVEIRDRTGRQLITVIELLSPANKHPGPDRQMYLAKRRQILSSGAYLVELDLLRGGPRLPVEGLPACDYCAMVTRHEERPSVGIWPVFLRGTLPSVPIPLRAPDSDAMLDLKPLLDRVYDAAGYEDYIYEWVPEPALNAQDAEWARQFVPDAPADGT